MTTKICTKCKIEKSISEFSKLKIGKDGFRYNCKDCEKQYSISLGRTKIGLMKNIYQRQKDNSKKRKMPMPNYSREQLINFCYDNNLNGLFDNWEKNNFDRDLMPSIDRLDDFKPYTLDNIQLITWGENKQKAYKDGRLGIGTSGASCKAIVQYDKDMNVVNEFVSGKEATRCLGYRIHRPLASGKLNTKGFYFKYKSP